MASIAPVCSPTAIICVTMPGNTSDSFKGSVSDLPSSSDFLTFCKALSTTALPAVLAVMSRPSRMGTPLEIKDGAPEGHEHEQAENAADKITESDDDFRGQREIHAKARKQRGENRHDLPEQQGDHAAGDGQDAHRIDKGGLDGALQLDVLFDVGRETLQNGVQNTAGLARFDHVYIQR